MAYLAQLLASLNQAAVKVLAGPRRGGEFGVEAIGSLPPIRVWRFRGFKGFGALGLGFTSRPKSFKGLRRELGPQAFPKA